MSQYDTIYQHLLTLLRAHLGPAREIAPESLLVDDLGIDSVVAMEMLMDMEDHLDVAIPMNVLPDVHSVDDLVRAIEAVVKPT